MKTADYLWALARNPKQQGLPILSFPAVQHMQANIRELTSNSELQAQAMKIAADKMPAAACVSLMDLSVEAEAFGASALFLITRFLQFPVS